MHGIAIFFKNGVRPETLHFLTKNVLQKRRYCIDVRMGFIAYRNDEVFTLTYAKSDGSKR